METPGTVNSINGKAVLITGASGFIGSHLSRRLLSLGAEVHILLKKNSPEFRIKDILDDLTVWYGDITDYKSVLSCIKNSKPRIIFHLAAFTNVTRDLSLAESMIEVNTKGTINLVRGILEKRIELDSFINTGSSEEYGNSKAPFREEQREVPVSPYSASKVAATYFCQMVNKTAGVPIATLRPFLTYGPFQSTDMFIPSLITHCLDGKDFSMTEGDQTREFNYVDDVVDAYVLAACHPEVAGKIINIGNGIEHRVRDVAEKIVKLMGDPIRLLVNVLPKRRGEAEHFFCNNERARRLLGWNPKVNLDEGLGKTIQFYRDYPPKF
ncbi:GDP-6-deoxy-D-mannose reductase [bacterium BMS3Abin10]|nr:GDP-6-deoxy-D-mannose reductase [bacterium BMS3Abin10]